ncbi:MurR/RpiR family transcriptional regulator [Nonomuraea sp. NPDC050404]|uniref:MurR/RpiR family transcriptional regulator n=1 Tax=Nonomuraea sp. NPDC050404 TaxID=3155783 RepID=UPI0033C3A471
MGPPTTTERLPVGGIIARLRELLPTMPEAQRTIAARVLAAPDAVARMTIVSLADHCGVSTGSVTRLCRALGLHGYAEMRIALASDSGRIKAEPWSSRMGADVAAGDDIPRLAEVISAAVSQAVGDTLQGLDREVVGRAALAVAGARRVWVFGIGGSGTVASELQQRLHSIGSAVWTSFDTHFALSATALLGRRDVVIGISHSGRTQETVELIGAAASNGATTIAITNDAGSPLARRAGMALITGVRQEGLRTEALSTRHGQLAVIDLLFVATAQCAFEQAGETMLATRRAVASRKDLPSDPGGPLS